jgi:hypothetical protein
VRQCLDASRSCRADAPARDGRDRLRAELPQLIGAPAAADHQRRDAAFLRRQLQPSALREIEGCDLRHHGVEAGAAQCFLHRPERIGITLDAQMQQSVGIDAAFRQGAGIKIALPCNPQGAAMPVLLAAADKARHGGGGEARFLEIWAEPDKFVQGAQGKATAGEMKVNGAEAPGERTHGDGVAHPGLRQLLQEGDLTPQGRQARRLGCGGKRWFGRGMGLGHVLFLFSSQGESRRENIKRTLWLTNVFCVM